MGISMNIAGVIGDEKLEGSFGPLNHTLEAFLELNFGFPSQDFIQGGGICENTELISRSSTIKQGINGMGNVGLHVIE